jgi:hypothetical protein
MEEEIEDKEAKIVFKNGSVITVVGNKDSRLTSTLYAEKDNTDEVSEEFDKAAQWSEK